MWFTNQIQHSIHSTVNLKLASLIIQNMNASFQCVIKKTVLTKPQIRYFTRYNPLIGLLAVRQNVDFHLQNKGRNNSTSKRLTFTVRLAGWRVVTAGYTLQIHARNSRVPVFASRGRRGKNKINAKDKWGYHLSCSHAPTGGLLTL